MKRFSGRLALVTGAARGIGRALSIRLAEEGCRLVLLDINEDGLLETAEAVFDRGGEVWPRLCDLASLDEIAANAAWVIEHFDGVDLLVNNAGLTYYGQSEFVPPSVCDALVDVNLRAPMQLTRLMLSSMLRREEPHVLNIASLFGLIGWRKLAVYSACKHGLVGYGEALRAEYGRAGLGVTTLCPGFVDTGLFDGAELGPDLQANKRPPEWTLVTPERVADAAVKAIRRNRRVVTVQRYAGAAHWLKRFAPWLIDLANRSNRRRRAPQKAATPSVRRAA